MKRVVSSLPDACINVKEIEKDAFFLAKYNPPGRLPEWKVLHYVPGEGFIFHDIKDNCGISGFYPEIALCITSALSVPFVEVFQFFSMQELMRMVMYKA